jgi:GTP pyrophosphokinase
MEFQIRTLEMHDEAEYGVAAHWHYDEHGVRLPARNVEWAQELAKLQKEILNNLSDLEEMKIANRCPCPPIMRLMFRWFRGE